MYSQEKSKFCSFFVMFLRVYMYNIHMKTKSIIFTTIMTFALVSCMAAPAGLSLKSISVTKNPDKMVYIEGETFDPTGMVVQATYYDSTTKNVEGYTWQPFNALSLSDTKVTIYYTENSVTKTTDFSITVTSREPVEKKLDHIAITKSPNRISYKEGELFEPDGMVVNAYYTDSTNKAITNYTWSPNKSLTLDDTVITVSYTEENITKQAKLNILVSPDVPPGDAVFNNVPTYVSGKIGESYQFFPTAKEGYYTNNNFRYLTPDNKGVIGILNNKIEFYSKGKETLMIYSDDNFNNIKDSTENYQLVDFNISEPETKIEPNGLYIRTMAEETNPGFDYDLNCQVLPSNATYRKIRYISDNPSVVNVNEKGKCEVVSLGKATVTAYIDKNNNDLFDEGEISTFCKFVSKTPATPRTITLDETTVTIKVGETIEVKPKLDPSKSGVYYGAHSYDESICIASSNTASGYSVLVTGAYPGETDVKVTLSEEGVATLLHVKVVKDGDKASKVVINNKDLVLDVGDSLQLSHNLVPIAAKDNVTYSSNNSNVVSVTEDGFISAKAQGTAMITVQSTDSSFVNDLLTVVVKSDKTYEVNSYYGDLSWENSQDLVNKLHTIIRKNYTALKYDKPNWESNQKADEDIGNPDYVNAIYSNEPILKTNTQKGWQREHCFAATLMTGYGTGDAVKTLGRATDFHNLYAAGASGNQSRSNKNFGWANPLNPNYNDKIDYKYDKYNFEPVDADKGKIARAIFYMTVMYNDFEDVSAKETWTFITPEDKAAHTTKTKTTTYNLRLRATDILENYVDYEKINLSNFLAKGKNASGSYVKYDAYSDLYDYYAQKLVDSGSTLNPESDEFRIKAYELYCKDYSSNSIGNLSTLISWNSNEVDAQEIQHCNSVYKDQISVCGNAKQGNRNPFVDYPELVNYIFGALKDVPGSLSLLKPTNNF